MRSTAFTAYALLIGGIFMTLAYMFVRCSAGISISSDSYETLEFHKLPAPVQGAIREHLQETSLEDRDFFMSTDSTILFQYGREA